MSHCIARFIAALFAVVFVSAATDVSAQTPQVFSGTGVDGVTAAIASFKAAIGGADNGAVTGSQPAGFRQVTWDDVPDSLATPRPFVDGFDFYNTASPRGLLLRATPVLEGQEPNALEVSANAANPGSTPVLFGNINPALPSYLAAFSPQRIFGVFPLYRDPVVFVTFKVPGTSTSATVSGFGAVFTDVNLTGSTQLSFYDLNNGSLVHVYGAGGQWTSDGVLLRCSVPWSPDFVDQDKSRHGGRLHQRPGGCDPRHRGPG